MRRKQTKSAAAPLSGKPGLLVEARSLGDFGTHAMGIYADEVNLGRAVPDLVDGLKPVQRRILWAISTLGKDFVKTARAVGECFAAGTQITLASGETLPIEDVRVGDTVLHDKGTDKVVDVFVVGPSDLYEIVTDRSTVRATPDQIFYCVDPDGSEVERTPVTLRAGDRPRVLEAVATVISVQQLPGKHTTYDFEVANRHRFYANGFLVHNCMGRFHPHGDKSTSDAIVTMVQANTPTVAGKGGWGNLIDPASAMRYTNCTLSHYGWTFFDPNYVNKQVTSFVPNYDDTTVEPVSLPALLPNVLLNGGEGIGVGTTTCLPSFTPESIAAVIRRRLAGEQLTAVDYAKTLKYHHRWGGRLVRSAENKKNWLSLFTAPTATVLFEAELKVDRDTKSIEIDDWPQGLNPVKFIAKVRALPECAQAFNVRGATCFRIECRKDYNLAQFDKFAEKLAKMTVVRRSFKLNVTHRRSQIDDGVVSFKTEYLSLSVPDLLTAWLRERLQLEKRSLLYRIGKQQALIDYSNLLIFACDHLETIFKALRQQDSKAYIMKHLKLTSEQADQILDLKVRQLSKLDQGAIKEKLKQQQAELKQLQGWLAAPKAKVAADIDAVLAAIEKDRRFAAAKGSALSAA